MPNPILEQLRAQSGNSLTQSQIPSQLPLQNNSQFQAIKKLYKMAQNSNNPNAALQSLMASNPQFQQVIQLVNNSNMNPQQFFMNLAKQKGINPDTFIQELQK